MTTHETLGPEARERAALFALGAMPALEAGASRLAS